jgi:hypothetical protein
VGELRIWNLKPIEQAIADPTGRACQLASLDHPTWRQLVVNATFDNPCQPPPLPKIDHT